MDYTAFILLIGAMVASAAPAAKMMEADKDELKAEEGRQQYTHVQSPDYHPSAYSAPRPILSPSSYDYNGPQGSYGQSSRRAQGSGTVTSYNRRGPSAGSYSQPGSKPEEYGLRFSAPAPYNAPRPGPVAPGYSGHRDTYAQAAQVHAVPSNNGNAYANPGNKYGDYGPTNNAYSAQSQQYSQDPSYDAAKDPVSQYADYVPVREYGPKTHNDNRELSIYGYK